MPSLTALSTQHTALSVSFCLPFRAALPVICLWFFFPFSLSVCTARCRERLYRLYDRLECGTFDGSGVNLSCRHGCPPDTAGGGTTLQAVVKPLNRVQPYRKLS